jgi:hypothetical protein
MKDFSKRGVLNKLFILFSLFLVFGAISVYAGNTIINGRGIKSPNYHSWNGNLGITFNMSIKEMVENNYRIFVENGLIVGVNNESEDGEEDDDEPGVWNYKKKITLTENSGNDLVNYSIRLNIFYDSDMQRDFDDLRFFDEEHKELPYWIESKSEGNNAFVWVKIQSLSANSTNAIYMYYGNDGVSTTSDATNAFLVYDDFERPDETPIHSRNWCTFDNFGDACGTGGYAIVEGILDSSKETKLWWNGTKEQLKNLKATYLVRSTDNLNADLTVVPKMLYSKRGDGRIYWTKWSTDRFDMYSHGDVVVNTTVVTQETNKWWYLSVSMYNGYYCAKLWDNLTLSEEPVTCKLTYTETSPSKDELGSIGLFGYDSYINVDEVFFRPYVEPEPTYSFGPEQPI